MVIAPRVVGPRKLPVRQGSPEWLEARRNYITATDIAAIMGDSPWKCEADVAAEKLGIAPEVESTVRMRIGQALEPFIAAEYEAQTGRKVRHVHGLWESRRIPWAAASPDATAAGRLIELKYSGSSTRWADGLPKDVEDQVAWQMFVAESPVCDVAALVGDDLRIYTVEANRDTEDNLVAVAADFRRRLVAGGPFEHTLDSVKRMYPTDDGVLLEGTPKWRSLAKDLGRVRAETKAAKATQENLEKAIREMLGAASGVKGDGWELTCRANREANRINWPAVAQGWRQLITAPEEEIEAVLSIHTETVQGPRVLRTSFKGATDD